MSELPPEQNAAKSEHEHPLILSLRLRLQLAGLIFLLGVSLLAIQVGWIWYCVRTGDEQISISQKLIIGGIVCISLSVVVAVGGQRLLQFFEMNRNLATVRWYEWLFFCAVFAVAALGYQGFMEILKSYGFREIPR